MVRLRHFPVVKRIEKVGMRKVNTSIHGVPNKRILTPLLRLRSPSCKSTPPRRQTNNAIKNVLPATQGNVVANLADDNTDRHFLSKD